MGAMSAQLDGEGGGRTHLVPAEVELEEVVEEVVRAMPWEAAVKKSEVCVLLPPGPRAERPDLRFDVDAGVAGHVDDDRTFHPRPEQTTAQQKCATPLAQTHSAMCVCAKRSDR